MGRAQRQRNSKSKMAPDQLSRNRRLSFLEILEDRRMMAVNWRNPADSLDVNTDGFLVPQDALVVINRLNANGSGPLPATKPPQDPFSDVNGDGVLAPLDALRIINYLNVNGSGARVLKEGSSLASQSEITITVGQDAGARKYRLGLNVQFDTSDSSGDVEDVFSVYLVHPENKTQTLLDRGHAGTALFQLQGSRVERREGITSWDGSTLEIDLSSIPLLDTATLVLQLINQDSDSNGRVTVTSESNIVHESDTPADADPPLQLAVAPGGPQNVNDLTAGSDVQPQLENIRLDAVTGHYFGDLRLNGNALSKAIVSFPNLPTGATLHNASGATNAGVPYINMQPGLPGSVGGKSDRVLVEFDDLPDLPFAPQFEVFVETSRDPAPILPPIGTITVNPGGFFSQMLNATDSDGDFITYSIASATGVLPTGRLRTNGLLSFEPTEEEIGTYDFEVVASDGVHRTRQPVTVIVQNDTLTTTRLSGIVKNTRGEALVGVQVSMSGAVAATAANGTFTLDFGGVLPGDEPVVVHGETIAGEETYSQYELPLNGLFRRSLLLGENNQLDRPIFLTPMSVAASTQIVHDQRTSVTNPNIPGAELTVFPNSVFDGEDNPYNGPMMLAEVPLDRTLIELPEGTLPAKAYTILPVGLKFSQSPLLKLPNDAGLDNGDFVELCQSAVQKQLNPLCGGGGGGLGAPQPVQPTHKTGYEVYFDERKDSIDVDVEEVSECEPCDSQTKGKEGPSPPGSPPSLFPNGRGRNRRDIHEYEADNRKHGVQLIYDTDRADPQSVLRFGVDQLDGGDAQRLMGQLTLLLGGFEMQVGGNAGGQMALAGGEQFWKLPSGATGANAALLADLSELSSGTYSYRLTAGNAHVANGVVSAVTKTLQSSVINVNAINSPFGAGWGLAGWQEIVKNADGSALLIDGDGTRLNFKPTTVPGKYQSPPADFSTLELLPNGTFRRTMPNKTVFVFGSSGKLSNVTDSTGYQISYGYTAGGQLEKVIDGGGRATTFAYSGLRIATITDPAGRTTNLTHDSSGNLVQMQYADGAMESWEYDDRHRMTAQVGPVGERTELDYDLAGYITDMTRGDGSEVHLTPTGSAGVRPAAETRDPVHSPISITQPTDVALYTDGNGHVTTYHLDPSGQFRSATDEIGNLGTQHRVHNLVTHETDGRGNATLFVFDGQGNVVSRRDSLSADRPVQGTFAAEGDRQVLTFQGVAGQRMYFALDTLGTVFARLTKPDGLPTSVFDGQFLDINQSGEYELEFSSDGPGNTFFAQLFDITQVEELHVGDVRIGTLASGFGPEVFRITGTAGQSLVVRDFLPPSSPRVAFRLYDPKGNPLVDQFGRPLDVLPQDGNYLLLLDRNPQQTAPLFDYYFTILSPQVIDHTLAFNQSTTLTVAEAGERHRYSFSGSIGQRLVFDRKSGTGGDAVVIAPSGAETDPDTFTPITLTESGTYSLLIRASAPGEIKFLMHDVGAETEIELGTAIDGSLAARNFRNVYRLEATAGQRFAIDAIAGSSTFATYFVFDPFDQTIESEKITLDFAFTAKFSGTYVLTAEVFSEPIPVTYTFRATDVTDPPVTPSGFDEVHSGEISAGEVESFTFSANAGTAVFFDSQLHGEDNLFFVLRDADNTTVNNFFGEDAGPFLLPRSGTYTVSARGNTSSSTGSFQFRMLDADNAPILATGERRTGQMSEEVTDLFRVIVGANESLFFDNLSTVPFFQEGGVLIKNSSEAVVFNSVGFSNTNWFTPTQPGTFYVVLEASNSTSVEYDFRFLNSADAAPLSFSGGNSGTLDPGNSARLFSFAGTKGEQVLVHSSISNSEVNWQIHGPLGDVSFARGLNNDLDNILPADGTYYLFLDGDANSPQAFDFQAASVEEIGTAPLTFNSPITASFTKMGEKRVFTFTGVAGQRLALNGLDPAGQDARIRIRTLTGNDVSGLFDSTTNDTTTGAFTLDQTGEYRLELVSLRAGDADFQIFDIGSLPATPFDTLISGSLPGGRLQEMLFAVDGVAGMTLYTDNPAVTGQNQHGQLTLYGPDNFSVSNSNGDLQVQLQETGRYFLQLQPENNPFSFAFNIQTPETTAVPLTLGTTVESDISEPGETDLHTFDAAAGTNFFLNVLTVGPQQQIQLLDPHGELVATPDSLAYRLNEAGSYAVRVLASNGQTGDYSFVAQEVASQPSVPFDADQSGRIDTPQEADLYRVEATSGQRLRFELLSTTGSTNGAQWLLYSPWMQHWFDPIGLDDFDVTIAETGTYLLALLGGTTAFDYNFRVTDISDPPAAVSGMDEVYSGTIDPDEVETFSFSGPAGHRFLFDGMLDGTSNLSIVVKNPDNTDFFFAETSTNIGPTILPRSGSYSVEVRGTGPEATGDFSFRIIDLEEVPALPLDMPVTGTLNPGSSTHAFQLQGQAGQQLLIDLQTENLFDVPLEMFGPDFLRLNLFGTSIFTSSPRPLVLTQTGTYYLLLSGQSSDPTDFAFQVIDLGGQTVTPRDTEISAHVGENTLAVHVIEATVGEELLFDVTERSATFVGEFEVFDPAGDQLFSDALGNQRPIVAAATGRYYIVVNSDSDPIDYKFRIRELRTPRGTIEPITALKGRTRYTYDPEFSRLTSLTDELGHQSLYQVDPANGNRLSTTEVLGAVGGGDDLTTSYTYLAGGVVDTMTDPLGRVTDYDYNAAGLVSKTTVAKGTVDEAILLYAYDAAGNRTEGTDENGHRSTYTYDAVNRLKRVTSPDPDGLGPLNAQVSSYTYDATGNLLSITDPRGNVTRYAYDALNRRTQVTDASGGVTRYEYDAEGNRTATIDRLNRRTTSEFDARNRLTRDTDPLLHSTRLEYDLDDNPIAFIDALDRRTETTLDARNRETAQKDALGNHTTLVYDSADRLIRTTDRNGNIMIHVYDDANRLISMTDPLGGVSSSTYDKAGNAITTRDELGRSTSFEYDGRNRLVRKRDAQNNVSLFVYDAVGNLRTSTDALNRATVYEYDALNRVVKITDPLSGIVEMAYDANGNLLSTHDKLGRETLYQYDVLNRLTRVTDPQTKTMQNAYDAEGNLTSSTDRLNRVTTFTYDGKNRLLTTKDPLGGVMSMAYDAAGNVLSSKDELNRVTLFSYDALNRVVSATDPLGGLFQQTFDPNGNPLTARDELGRVTHFEYDALDRLIHRQNPLGDSNSVSYDAVGNLLTAIDELGRTTSYVYDSLNRMTRQTDSLEQHLDTAYDAVGRVTTQTDKLGRVTSFGFDALDRLTTITDPLLGASSFTYDALGNTLSQTDPLNHTTQFVYDTLNRMIRVTDPLNGVSEFTYDAEGNQITSKDELNRVTTMAYDDLDRLTTVTDALNGEDNMTYDAVGNLLSHDDRLGRTSTMTYDGLNRLTAMTDPLAHATAYQYDLVGNLLKTTDALSRESTMEYDALNRPVKSTDPLAGVRQITYDKVGNVLTTADELNRVTTMTYDVLNRTKSMADPLGQVTRYAYDAMDNLLSVTDPLNHISSYGYDALDRRTSDKDANGDETRFVFDAVGNLLTVTDPLNNGTHYAYDALNRLTSETNARNDSRTFAYDAVDNLLTATDRNGRKREYAYDALNRRTNEKWLANDLTVLRSIGMEYDAAGQLMAANDPDANYAFTYDQAGRNTSVTNAGTVGVPIVAFQYGYDIVNNRTSREETIAGLTGATNGLTYDPLNRLTKITQSGGTASAKRIDLSYNAASQMTNVARFSDLGAVQPVASSAYGFDNKGRLTSLNHQQGATTLAEFDWTFDVADRITEMTTPDGSSSFTYDSRNQLTAADHESQTDEAYTYDENGNRTGGYQTDVDNRVASDGKFNYEYDAEGNRTRRVAIADGTVTEYEWDYRNRLTHLVTKSSVGDVIRDVTYKYDLFDRRLEKSVDADGAGPETATVARYVYDGSEIAVEFDGAGNLTHRYVYGPMIDQVLADDRGAGDVLWPLTDHLGTVRDLVDSSSDIVNHLNYDSFGQITSESNAAVDHLFGYTGRERDDESGLDYYRARYYDPAIGRFVSQDPIGFSAGDANLYRYVGNSPLVATDPGGLQECSGAKTPEEEEKEKEKRLKGELTETYDPSNTWHKDKAGNLVNDNGEMIAKQEENHRFKDQEYKDARGGPIDHTYIPPANHTPTGGDGNDGNGGGYGGGYGGGGGGGGIGNKLPDLNSILQDLRKTQQKMLDEARKLGKNLDHMTDAAIDSELSTLEDLAQPTEVRHQKFYDEYSKPNAEFNKEKVKQIQATVENAKKDPFGAAGSAIPAALAAVVTHKVSGHFINDADLAARNLGKKYLPTEMATAAERRVIQKVLAEERAEVGIRATDPISAHRVQKASEAGVQAKYMKIKEKTNWGLMKDPKTGKPLRSDLDLAYVKKDGRFLTNEETLKLVQKLNRRLIDNGLMPAFQHGDHFNAPKLKEIGSPGPVTKYDGVNKPVTLTEKQFQKFAQDNNLQWPWDK